MKLKAAITTTLINGQDVVHSFVKYHLSIGFDHIYLFFDDVNDKSIGLIEKINGVTAIRHDEDLKQLWERTSVFQANKHLHSYIYREAMARQTLNMEVACTMARQNNIDWMVHIDIDELFFSPNESIHRHFRKLERNNVYHWQYMNYEGVPEALDIKNFFRDVTLFKKHPNDFTVTQRIKAKKKFSTPKGLFNYYNIGKMGAAVRKIHTPGIHQFGLNIGKRTLRADWFWYMNKIQTFVNSNLFKKPGEPIILHYPVCGFDHFWSKYVTLGKFEDTWFGFQPIFEFHRNARDVVGTGNREEAKRFFEKHVMIEQERLETLLRDGFLCRISDVVRIVGNC
jgi:hypothetical protein